MWHTIKFIIIGAVFTSILIFVIVFSPQNFGQGQEKYSISPPQRPSEYADFLGWYDAVALMKDLVQRHAAVSAYELTPLTTLNNTLYALEIKSEPDYRKAGVLVVGVVDAMAWSSVSAVIELAFDILYISKNSHFLQDYDWYLVPAVNPDGLNFTQSVRDLKADARAAWRRNMSDYGERPREFHKNLAELPGAKDCFGVNLGLNFAYHWNDRPLNASAADACAQDYPGGKPFSESEAIALRQYVDRLAGIVNIAVQLGAIYAPKKESILYPWAFSKRLASNYKVMQKVGEAAARNHPLNNGRIIEVKQFSARYPEIGGTLIDYLKGVVGMELVYLVELEHLPMPASAPYALVKRTAEDPTAKREKESLAEEDGFAEEESFGEQESLGRTGPSADYVRDANAIVLGLVRARSNLGGAKKLTMFGTEKQY